VRQFLDRLIVIASRLAVLAVAVGFRDGMKW
jgi:hypothetical protein